MEITKKTRTSLQIVGVIAIIASIVVFAVVLTL